MSQDEISDLTEDSKHIFKCNMIDRYIDRPNADYENRKYAVLDSMFCRIFAILLSC